MNYDEPGKTRNFAKTNKNKLNYSIINVNHSNFFHNKWWQKIIEFTSKCDITKKNKRILLTVVFLFTFMKQLYITSRENKKQINSMTIFLFCSNNWIPRSKKKINKQHILLLFWNNILRQQKKNYWILWFFEICFVETSEYGTNIEKEL